MPAAANTLPLFGSKEEVIFADDRWRVEDT